MERLFSYGTLQQENVQLETFGRKLKGSGDILIGYQLSEIRIIDPQVIQTSGKEFHPILKYTGNFSDEVEGTVFEISAEELAQSDAYEVDAYQRVAAKLKSCTKAWIYAEAN
ncbi:gamma-glutamylcyclotransferase family protein [Microbulbifer sp. THAF38]|uniref:gamma-glutamylcyclotransferase family protein n=1 Tax=Microbulbifer sp. THAF38 TaxID=2587856 RepID=UPI00126972C5|nr:gamma-glutamylcyclotransferase family protein [Microbulbifer sp. THAF38]QFT56534.1 AIG2-like family protein [Microbulbifer sp. THAF38]